MKKILLVVLFMLFMGFASAQDIEVNEPQPDITLWRLDVVRMLVFTKTCEVYYRKGYMDNGKFISSNQVQQILFMDTLDNPNTPEDETSTEFTQLIQLINSENNIKQSITKAVKIKLGIE